MTGWSAASTARPIHSGWWRHRRRGLTHAAACSSLFADDCQHVLEAHLQTCRCRWWATHATLCCGNGLWRRLAHGMHNCKYAVSAHPSQEQTDCGVSYDAAVSLATGLGYPTPTDSYSYTRYRCSNRCIAMRCTEHLRHCYVTQHIVSAQLVADKSGTLLVEQVAQIHMRYCECYCSPAAAPAPCAPAARRGRVRMSSQQA